MFVIVYVELATQLLLSKGIASVHRTPEIQRQEEGFAW